jgi:hypothetical protein
MEAGAVLGLHGLEVLGDAFNDWHPAMFWLG